MKFESKDMEIGIDGLGFALYSPDSTKDIPLESDFFEDEFMRPQDIERHIKKGDVVGFCTGTSGDFILKFREGYPDEKIDEEFPLTIRMGIEVKGGKINVVDVYWLMEFNPECPEDQVLYLEDGFYHITLNTKMPDSGIWGDDQVIYLYFNKIKKMPELSWEGIPMLVEDEY